MKKLLAAAIAVLLALSATSATHAAAIRIDASGGGNQRVYEIGIDRYLGLIGIDARGDQYDTSLVTEDLLLASIEQPDRVEGFYKGTGLVDLLGGEEFDTIDFDFAGPLNNKIFSAVWVEFTGSSSLGLLKWTADGSQSKRSGSLQANATLGGNPLAPAPVPLPAGLPLLLVGVGGLVWLKRCKTTA
ncbi:MAG: VPLPA-CTERM sorting domain-containing protein [Pseudomonadota bacterium]